MYCVYSQDNAKTPKITSFVIGPGSIQPHVHHFWCHEIRRTNLSSTALTHIVTGRRLHTLHNYIMS